jgi:hypothetical protein
MLCNSRPILGALSLLLVLGLPFAAARAQDDEQTAAGASPSQEARERINQLRANEFFYQSNDREDPFRALISGNYEVAEGAAELVEVASASLVGVMWGEEDRFALVEDSKGFGYILRVGDAVRNGRVVSIRTNAVTAQITLYGITSEVVLKLDTVEAK